MMEKRVPKRKPHVSLRVFKSGDRVLFDLKTRQTYKLNGSALEMWSLCDGSHSTEDITKAVVDKFDVDEKNARKDLEEFLGKLLSMKLVEM